MTTTTATNIKDHFIDLLNCIIKLQTIDHPNLIKNCEEHLFVLIDPKADPTTYKYSLVIKQENEKIIQISYQTKYLHQDTSIWVSLNDQNIQVGRIAYNSYEEYLEQNSDEDYLKQIRDFINPTED